MRCPTKLFFTLFGTIIFFGFGTFIIFFITEMSVMDELILPEEMLLPSLTDSNAILDRSDVADENEPDETIELSDEELDEFVSWIESLEEPEIEIHHGIEEKDHRIHEGPKHFDQDINDKVAERSMGMTAEQIETRIKMLYQEIPQNLEERIDLQKIVNELAPDYGNNPELDAIRDIADEEARELMFTIADMIADYASLSQDDTPFVPGGEFYGLLQTADVHLDVNFY